MEEFALQASKYILLPPHFDMSDLRANRNVDCTEKEVLLSLTQNEPAYSGLESQLAK